MPTHHLISRKIQSIYQKNYLEHGDTPQGTFQNDSVTQQLRFERLLKNFQPSFSRFPQKTNTPVRFLDVGCGTAGLHEYLNQLNISHSFTGLEIVKEMANTAKSKFPSINIINSDIMEFKSKHNYDIVLQSGMFNKPSVNIKKEWRNYCRQIVKKMYSLSKMGIAFNSLTTYNTFSDKSLFYFEPEEWFSFCQKNLSRYVFLDHAYPLYETAVTVLKPEFIATLFPENELKKYHKN
ncbi:MAG: hypothetical protein A3H98_02890 [Bacteroidetes bacterium RIFCSPLOWO2_02_FULL_36_8]|nr:MAG: hypothetical protein A3H98_02890 [Bacteroidetes bacterium RIFCSPLOWO2_02_FULL_36_8]OFY72224.1 MAG: hypothetical protein A3G23_01500 [Bacteroidetes bacterium RIFCSPLOWO2_12_FULL_37_12]